ncbi:2-succinyl-5-enolpyruvyl-6-hydroxy-3-cyclohexene-1-carboxylic-acid synthase [Leptodesmis sp.]|uniref:2-succinyl-5-enolpyruvyl-6-hydroxy-3- cyclohexene-1-carboxylic-acid synthase n=1 Tax=Leptodesmis sp. TaxID=3100501 RepID=UPI0040534A93
MTTIDFTNTNLLWTSILAETLYRLGLTIAIICPGSRSAPLTVAFANHPEIEAIPILDERSAAFFALGLARQRHVPVALVCTSGTAGANFFPAVIEARESQVPLLVITADRPPELRDCNAGQAINQNYLYGSFPNWYTELALPSLDNKMLQYLRQTLIHAWEQTLYPVAGPVHLNQAFREPLAPLPEPQAQAQSLSFNPTHFFASLPLPRTDVLSKRPSPPSPPPLLPLSTWHSCQQGLIIAGPSQPANPEAYCKAIAQLSQSLNYPVLAEGLSPLRNYADLNPHLITTYDVILRNAGLAEKLSPEVVIRIGEMPTSKQLRTWLEKTQPRQWIIAPSGRNLDPLHGATTHLHLTLDDLVSRLEQPPTVNPYTEAWCTADALVREAIDQVMSNTSDLFEGKVAWLLSKILPPDTPLFISSSMPVRDVEFFWSPNNSRAKPFFNRGANGIDGSLSTALGIAHHQPPSVMLTGDLALLHDTNGFLLRTAFHGHLTILLINNQGGGIFEMLPIAAFDPPFETFFATPQVVDFGTLCAAYGVEHERIQDWSQLAQRLNPLPDSGMRVLEICTDRKADAQWRQNNLGTFAANIALYPYAR